MCHFCSEVKGGVGLLSVLAGLYLYMGGVSYLLFHLFLGFSSSLLVRPLSVEWQFVVCFSITTLLENFPELWLHRFLDFMLLLVWMS